MIRRTICLGVCALLLCSAALADTSKLKSLALLDQATGRTQTAPILQSSGADSRWRVYAPGALALSRFASGQAQPTLIADAVFMVLYTVAEQFSSPLTIVSGHGHAAGQEGVDFRIEGIGASYVYDFCLRFPLVGVGLHRAPTMAEQFVHLDARRPAQCWSEPQGPPPARCRSQNLVPPRLSSPRVFSVLFVDAHDSDRPYWLPMLYDPDGRGRYHVSPVGRAELQRLLRDRVTGATRNIPDLLILRLTKIYAAFGRRPIGILSGVRFTSSVAHSQHPQGTAIDLYLPGQDMMQLWRFCLRAFSDGGAGFYPRTETRMAFVHIDVRRGKACWVDPPLQGQHHCPG